MCVLIFYPGPECVISSECPLDKACVQQRCENPCLRNPCAPQAICKVVNHSPICTCPPNYVGNPFVSCELEQKRIIETDPCNRKYPYSYSYKRV